MGAVFDEEESHEEAEEKGDIDEAEKGAECVVESVAHIGVAEKSIEGGDDNEDHDGPEEGVGGKDILIGGRGLEHVEPGGDAKYDAYRGAPFT